MTRKFQEPPDTGLWEEVKRSIKPLALKIKKKSSTIRLSKSIEVKLHVNTYAPLAPAPLKRRAAFDIPPPLAAMDRRTAQRLGRGQIEPEARLDLHGEGLETGRMKLLHFLSSQRHLGLRLVLVITGKGASPFARHTLHGTTHFNTPEREGRLRREVPLWLHEEAFRLHAVGYQPAHPRHGGGGAFYIRLRRIAHQP
jgi:DNA-nicking Smr family endonuclease